MNEAISRIVEQAKEALLSAQNLPELDSVRVKYLGKKGELTAILKGMGGLTPDERKAVGQAANEARAVIESALTTKLAELKEAELNARLAEEVIDVTMPGNSTEVGRRHPLNIVVDEIKEIFLGMGFDVVEGPEVEKDYYNFEALNIPKDHPARDMQDTFYISDEVVLRTQTSPVQIRTMENRKPPIRIIAPGKVYRSDAIDATHSPLFHQIEGMVIDKGVTMADLKGTLDTFAKRLYGEDTVTVEGVLSDEESERESERICDRVAISQSINRMPPVWRQIVILRYYRNMTQQQVAALLGLTQVKISREEKKILEFLRKELA